MLSIPIPLLIRWPRPDDPLLAALRPDKVLGQESIPGAVTRGLWPGTRDAGKRERDADIASASREPWVDSSGYLAAFERALEPGTVPVLAHRYDDPERGVPFDTLELALIEARVNGGNFVLSVEPRYRAALERKDSNAMEAWQSLARTAHWLRTNEALFGRPAVPAITAMVERSIASSEIANLLYRRGASPRLTSAVPRPEGVLALVAAGLKSVPAGAYAVARAGAALVMDAEPAVAAKLIRTDPDRRVFEWGRGRIVAYGKRVQDPSEFALDVIDIVTHRKRAARLWNAPASIPLATEGGLLHIVQYGSSPATEVQARVAGHYTSATLLRPESPPLELKIYRRGEVTEVFPPEIRRIGVVAFR
jgi:hypothetical protein